LAHQSFILCFSGVDYMSCRQVLTLVDDSWHLLRHPNINKTRHVAFHLQCSKGNYNNCFFYEKSESGTLIPCLPLQMMSIAKHSPPTDDAKHQHFMLLHQSTSLSQLNTYFAKKCELKRVYLHNRQSRCARVFYYQLLLWHCFLNFNF
jgi:hypothetical protein